MDESSFGLDSTMGSSFGENTTFGGSTGFGGSMSLTESMPNLPGYARTNRPRATSTKQAFHVVNGVMVEDSGPKRKGPATRSLGETQSCLTMTNIAPDPLPKSKNNMPALLNKSSNWLNNAGKVLQFYGYFKEGVNESAMESFRVRSMVIYYYMEDGTMQINEKAQENSGIPQGVFLKRQKLFRPDREGGSQYMLEDLKIGGTITLFGRVYKITNASGFTRQQLNQMGLDGDAQVEDIPADSYSTKRAAFMQMETGADPTIKRGVKKGAMKKHMEASLGNTVNNGGRRKFEDYDRVVLRFTGAWDNTCSMFGDQQFFTLHYFVADDTIEVLEQHQNNNGRDPFPYLIRRGKLPRQVKTEDANGRADEADESEYYQWSDFQIGEEINVWSRWITLISCDSKTRDFYQRMGMPLNSNIDGNYKPEPPAVVKNPIPEHTQYSFGSPEDSLNSCGSLVPKPKKTEFDKHGVKLPNKVLRFAARMDTTRYDDVGRQFVIMFYLADSHIQVREPPVRNSGVVGGMWLKKQRVANKAAQQKGGPTVYFRASDFYAGARVVINHSKFIVSDVDEHTLGHMETEPGQFPLADINHCLGLVRDAISDAGLTAAEVFEKMDRNGDGRVGVAEFLPALMKIFSDAGVPTEDKDGNYIFPDQVVITIFRKFDADRSGAINLQEFVDQLN